MDSVIMHPPKINPREVKTTSMLFEAVSKKVTGG